MISQEIRQLNDQVAFLSRRLDRLEGVAARPAEGHPSLDKFTVAEAIVDSLFAASANEKACTFEPSKPCDHCSMCNSRGF